MHLVKYLGLAAALLLYAGAGEAAQTTCSRLMLGTKSRKSQARVAQIISADEDDSDAFGFVGVSEAELISLINHGRLRAEPTVRVKGAGADASAARDAWARTVRDVLRTRRSGTALNYRSTLPFLAELAKTPSGREDTFSPSFTEINEAVESSNMVRLGQGKWARVRRLTTLMNTSWQPMFRRGSVVERELRQAFADLPRDAGARLALKPHVGERLKTRRDPYRLGVITINDVLAIRPNSVAINDLLDEVQRRAGVR